MKKIGSIALILCVTIAVQAQEKFTIKGKLSSYKSAAKIMLNYQTDHGLVQDSVLLKKGTFVLKGIVEKPVKAWLQVVQGGNEPLAIGASAAIDQVSFYLEKGKITVTGNVLKTATIKGDKTQVEYALLQTQVQPFQEKMDSLVKKMNKYAREENKYAWDETYAQWKPANQEKERVEDNFIRTHFDSYVSVGILSTKSVPYVKEPDTFEPLFNALSERLRNTREGKTLAAKLAAAKKIAIGQPATNFTQKNAEGIPVSLSSLNGKYVLIDFWASWCGPCRKENPHVVKAYDKFKNKNFEIIAVSLDINKEKWLKAIKDDGLPWIHVSDLQGWTNGAAQTYGVIGIPTNVLIDPNGIIIAKDLRGEALGKKLEEVIKE